MQFGHVGVTTSLSKSDCKVNCLHLHLRLDDFDLLGLEVPDDRQALV